LPNSAGRRQFIERMIEKEFCSDDSMQNMIEMDEKDI